MSFGRLLCSMDLLIINFSIKTEHDFSQKLGSVKLGSVQQWKAVRAHTSA
jgi:hypothetical protein